MDERTHARYMSDIAYFLSKMEAEPNSSYFIPIALAYNKLEKYDETIAMCKSAIERFPANCAAKTFLAEAYVYKGQFDAARELLFDVTAEDDNNYKALKLLGIICKENGDTTDALKYLTGAYIRSPEDEEVRKMIEELGGSLNPAQIYDERMKRQSQAALDDEEDEELKTYQEIDQRIRNAEIIMADLVSDTSISARDYSEEEDFYSDDPNDFMPLITQHPEDGNTEEDEELSDDPNDFLPTITQQEEHTDAEDSSQQIKDIDEAEAELVSALSGEDEDNKSSEDDLLSALSSDDEKSGEDDLLSALSEDSEKTEEDDLLSALSEEGESGDNDLLSALSEESDKSSDDDLLSALSEDNEKSEDNDLLSALSEDSEKSEDDDLLSALSEESDKSSDDDLLSALSEDNEKSEDDDLLSALSEESGAVSDDLSDFLKADSTESDADIESVLSEDDNKDSEELLDDLSESNETGDSDLLSTLSEESSVEESESSDNDIIPLETEDNILENEKTEDNILNTEDTASEDNVINEAPIEDEIIQENYINADSNSDSAEDIKTESSDDISDKEKEIKELYSKKIPSSVVDMTYDDMIDDDFQYGKIIDDNYNETDVPNIDLGESAPFTQGDIMDEILDAVGMTQEDMADDEQIEHSDKERKLERLEQFLEKVRNNKEDL